MRRISKNTAIQQAGDIRVVMITGDSPQCGVHIARECGLTGLSTPIYLGEFDSKQGTVVWHEMSAEDGAGEANLTTDELLAKVSSAFCVAVALECVACIYQKLTMRRTCQKSRITQHESKLKSGEVELAVTGSAFKILQLMGKAQELLYCSRVFARIKPEGKVSLSRCVCGEFEFRFFFQSPHFDVPRILSLSNVRRIHLKH